MLLESRYRFLQEHVSSTFIHLQAWEQSPACIGLKLRGNGCRKKFDVEATLQRV